MSVEAFKDALGALVGGATLSEDEAYDAVSTLMRGEVPDVLIASFLTALRQRGETTDELVGAARAMRDKVLPVEHRLERVLDTCGTGGDGSGTFNISTTVAFVAAAAGVVVGKHGNRAVSSSVGSADVLEALGVRIDLEPAAVVTCMHEIGIGFMFAPRHHGAMKHAAPVRRALGFRTMFNLLGPVTNPARATHQLLGLFDGRRLTQLAEVLARLGVRRALVVHGPEGMDELGLSGPSQAAMLADGRVTTRTIDAEALGFAKAPVSALRGGDARANAAIVRAVLEGRAGPARDVVALNAAAALWIGEQVDSLAEGVALASGLLDRGEAHARLERLVERTQALGGPA
jgi:anthranilate phosphoribosyltransferase